MSTLLGIDTKVEKTCSGMREKMKNLSDRKAAKCRIRRESITSLVLSIDEKLCLAPTLTPSMFRVFYTTVHGQCTRIGVLYCGKVRFIKRKIKLEEVLPEGVQNEGLAWLELKEREAMQEIIIARINSYLLEG